MDLSDESQVQVRGSKIWGTLYTGPYRWRDRENLRHERRPAGTGDSRRLAGKATALRHAIKGAIRGQPVFKSRTGVIRGIHDALSGSANRKPPTSSRNPGATIQTPPLSRCKGYCAIRSRPPSLHAVMNRHIDRRLLFREKPAWRGEGVRLVSSRLVFLPLLSCVSSAKHTSKGGKHGFAPLGSGPHLTPPSQTWSSLDVAASGERRPLCCPYWMALLPPRQPSWSARLRKAHTVRVPRMTHLPSGQGCPVVHAGRQASAPCQAPRVYSKLSAKQIAGYWESSSHDVRVVSRRKTNCRTFCATFRDNTRISTFVRQAPSTNASRPDPRKPFQPRASDVYTHVTMCTFPRPDKPSANKSPKSSRLGAESGARFQ